LSIGKNDGVVATQCSSRSVIEQGKVVGRSRVVTTRINKASGTTQTR
jgi:hypothetical protein